MERRLYSPTLRSFDDNEQVQRIFTTNGSADGVLVGYRAGV